MFLQFVWLRSAPCCSWPSARRRPATPPLHRKATVTWWHPAVRRPARPLPRTIRSCARGSSRQVRVLPNGSACDAAGSKQIRTTPRRCWEKYRSVACWGTRPDSSQTVEGTGKGPPGSDSLARRAPIAACGHSGRPPTGHRFLSGARPDPRRHGKWNGQPSKSKRPDLLPRPW